MYLAAVGYALAGVGAAIGPAGRLPITFPVAEGQLPLSYNHEPTGRGDDYLDLTGQPLFPFGFGLSYSTFAYSALTIDPDTIAADGSARVRLRVTVEGVRAAVKHTAGNHWTATVDLRGAALPTRLVEELALIGPRDKIRHDLEAWRESIVTTMLVAGSPELLRDAAELVLG